MTENNELHNLLCKLSCDVVWGSKSGIGSFFSLEIGNPHLKVREPIDNSSVELLTRRKVSILGDVSIWVQDCNWKIIRDNKLLLDNNSSMSNNNILDILNGERFSKLEIDKSYISIIFDKSLISIEKDNDPDNTLISFHFFLGKIYYIDGCGNIKYEA